MVTSGAGEVVLLLPLEMDSVGQGCQHCTEEGAGTGVPLCPVLGDRQDRDVSTPQGERAAVK